MSKESKSIDVKVNVPLTSASFMSIVLIGLLSLIGYAGYLGVNSVWKFTHPQFNVSLDGFKSLGYIAKNLPVPPIPGPSFLNEIKPEESATATFISSVNTFKPEFRSKFPESKLLDISDNEVLNFGWEFCRSKSEIISKGEKFVEEDVIKTFQARLVLQYPRLSGLDQYLDAVGKRAFEHLCGGN